MAPSWMQIVNSFTKGVDSIPRRAEVMIMCPVDEIGRNSVNPSTIAIINASKYVMKLFYGKNKWVCVPENFRQVYLQTKECELN
jgi:hypothetical protein